MDILSGKTFINIFDFYIITDYNSNIRYCVRRRTLEKNKCNHDAAASGLGPYEKLLAERRKEKSVHAAGGHPDPEPGRRLYAGPAESVEQCILHGTAGLPDRRNLFPALAFYEAGVHLYHPRCLCLLSAADTDRELAPLADRPVHGRMADEQDVLPSRDVRERHG